MLWIQQWKVCALLNWASLSWLQLWEISLEGRRWFFPAQCSWTPLETITKALNIHEPRERKKANRRSFWLGWPSVITFEKPVENRFSMDSPQLSRTSSSFLALAPLRAVFILDISGPQVWSVHEGRQTAIWQARNTASGTVIGIRKRGTEAWLGKRRQCGCNCSTPRNGKTRRTPAFCDVLLLQYVFWNLKEPEKLQVVYIQRYALQQVRLHSVLEESNGEIFLPRHEKPSKAKIRTWDLFLSVPYLLL